MTDEEKFEIKTKEMNELNEKIRKAEEHIKNMSDGGEETEEIQSDNKMRGKVALFVVLFLMAAFAVTKVIRAVELIHFPAKNGNLLGLINMMGQIIPVVNVRKHFQVKEREMDLNDRIIISQTSSREIAFIADKVEGIIELSPAQIDKAEKIFPDTGHCIQSVGKFDGGSVKICDIDKFWIDDLRSEAEIPIHQD